MENFQVEFLSFDETPDEKYLGVASLKIFGKIILRFKVQRTKDGNSMFVAIPSYRKTDHTGEQWCQWFMLDSSSQKEMVENLIKSKVKAYFKAKSDDASNSNSGGSFCSQNAFGGQSQHSAQKVAATSNGWDSQAYAPRTV